MDALQATVQSLEDIDAITTEQVFKACTSGTTAQCMAAQSAVFHAWPYGTVVDPSDPNYAAYLAVYNQNKALYAFTTAALDASNTQYIAQATSGLDAGAVAGASAALIAVAALEGTAAVTTVVSICGNSLSCYATFGTLAAADIQASAPELGGSGVGGDALAGALAEAKAALSGDPAAEAAIRKIVGGPELWPTAS